MSQQPQKSGFGSIIVLAIVIIMAFAMLASCFDSGTSSSAPPTRECRSCHREFTDATNRNYIFHTNMCRNCYRNYCWATNQTPTNYDK